MLDAGREIEATCLSIKAEKVHFVHNFILIYQNDTCSQYDKAGNECYLNK